MKMRFVPDEPITESEQDNLGYKDFVHLLKTSIYNTDPPFAYGVLGDWGTGKTSILKLLEAQMTQDLQDGTHSVIPIWFNAWEYENETNIIYPLLYAIKRDYAERLEPFDHEKKFWRKFGEVVATSFLALSDVGLRVATKQLTGEALKLEDINKQFESVREHPNELEQILGGWADQVSNLKQAFKTLLDIYAFDMNTSGYTTQSARFVILIDDLDRCLPDTTIAVLESIKNHLAVSNCIFVLGLNPKVIYQGVRSKYQGLEVDGREYLEKIVNYTFFVPEPAPKQIAKFATAQIDKLLIEEDDRNKYHGAFLQFGNILKECHFSNPRKIKRILNRYLYFISSNETTFSTFINANIVRLIIIAEFFPTLFQLFLDDTNVTKQVLEQLKGDLNISQFQEKFGVDVSNIAPKLRRMRGLFVLVSKDGDFKNLDEHVYAVFAITRLI